MIEQYKIIWLQLHPKKKQLEINAISIFWLLCFPSFYNFLTKEVLKMTKMCIDEPCKDN